MYFGQTEQILLKIAVEKIISDSKLIRGIIDRDIRSEKKNDMLDGINYYKSKHDIMKRDFRKYIVDGKEELDPNASNNKVPNSFHAELVDQKIEYILTNQISIASKNTTLGAKIKELQDKYFRRTLTDLATNASNKGEEWLHFFINDKGEFDYIIIPAEEIIPDYDDTYKNNLISILRYYKVDSIDDVGKLTQKLKVEIWTKDLVYFYIENDKGEFIPDASENPNPRPHWVVSQKMGEEVLSSEGKSWGVPPFIKLSNNNNGFTDLKPIKGLIDLYDLIFSGFANNIEDIQDAIWELGGYAGEKLAEFMTNLRKFKAIKVSEEGHVTPHTLEIPVEAKVKLLEIIEENIYKFGHGLNFDKDQKGGNIVTVVIKSQYMRLDIKANALINRLEDVISELIKWKLFFEEPSFVFNEADLEITFSKNMLINETEQITNCQNSLGIIPEKIILANHPWIKNVDDAVKDLETERANRNINLDAGNAQ